VSSLQLTITNEWQFTSTHIIIIIIIIYNILPDAAATTAKIVHTYTIHTRVGKNHDDLKKSVF